MKQAPLALDPLPKKTRKQVFLEEMDRVVPWRALVALTEACPREAAKGAGGRPPIAVETMLRIHCLQLWRNLSDPAMEEELHERPLYRRFAKLEGDAGLPDETTILRFRRLLEKHDLAPKMLGSINDALVERGLLLKTGTVVDATIIAAPSSTKNKSGEREDFQRETEGREVRCNIAMRPGKRRALDPERALHQLLNKAEKLKASIRAKVEHPFRLIKQQFGYAKVRYRGLAKNTARLTVMFALGNLWTVRRQLLAAQG